MNKTIEISDDTYELIKGQLGVDDQLIDVNELDDLVGGKYYFRTVTYHLVGKVEKRVGKFLELSTASWVADSGRFMNAIKDGALDEVEPTVKAWVNLDTVTDFYQWKHKLPTKQK